jgi:hypothetical protein
MPQENQDLPWEIDDKNERPNNYVLNSTDRLFCATGETPNDTSKSQVRSRIKNKRLKQLPARLQDIADDLALVEYSDNDFINESEWTEIYSDIADIDGRLDVLIGNSLIFSTETEHDMDIQFGYKLGIISRYLSDRRGRAEDISWGFLLGLISQPSGKNNVERADFASIIIQLERRFKKRCEFIQKHNEHSEQVEGIREENTQRILNQLQSYGLDISTIPLPEVHIYDAHSFETIPHNPEEIAKAIQQQSDIELLKSLDSLRWAVEHDGHVIKTTKTQGEVAKPIIRELWYRGVKSHSRDSPIKLPAEAIHAIDTQHLGKGTLNKLSDKQQKDPKTIHPVAVDDGGWKLTKYGQLVAYTLFEIDGWYPWIYRYDLFGCTIPEKPQELIEEALSEVQSK